MKINSFSVGSAPNHNEDFLKYENMGINGYAVVIADGMGGLRYGEIASKIACTTILSHIQANYRDFHSEFITAAASFSPFRFFLQFRLFPGFYGIKKNLRIILCNLKLNTVL